MKRDALSRVLPRPGAVPERRLRGRAFALMWAAGTIIVVASLAAPGAETQEPASLTVAAVSLAFALLSFAGAGRLPRWTFDVAVAAGSTLVSVLVWQSGGALSSFAPLYLWELAFAAAFLPAVRSAAQCALAVAGYAAAVAIADYPASAGRVAITISTMLVVPAVVSAVRSHVDRLVAGLDRQATTDELTGLANRRAFTAAVDLEHARAARTGRPASIVILDVDHFKAINDRHGHPVGDRALHHLADILRSGCRVVDVAARVGGEEFALLLPETDGAAALASAERLRAAIASSPTPDGVWMTASFGVAQTNRPDPLVAADQALYRAKTTGRDRCVLATPDSP